jgi:hypothetical protein
LIAAHPVNNSEHYKLLEQLASSNSTRLLKGGSSYNADSLSLLQVDNASYLLTYFLNLCGRTLGTAATIGLLYQPRMLGEGDCGGIGGIKIGRRIRSTRRKSAPAPLRPPQISHE